MFLTNNHFNLFLPFLAAKKKYPTSKSFTSKLGIQLMFETLVYLEALSSSRFLFFFLSLSKSVSTSMHSVASKALERG